MLFHIINKTKSRVITLLPRREEQGGGSITLLTHREEHGGGSIFLFLLLFCFCIHATAQVSVEAKLDSNQIYIGEQTSILLEVSADANQRVELPNFDSLQMIVPGVEVLRSTQTDTNKLNDGQRMTLSKRYYVTSFDSAIYSIPPLKVKVDGKDYETNTLGLKVYTVNIDTLHADSIFGMKAVMRPPFEWSDWNSLLWLSLLVLLLTSVLIYVAIRLKDNKPIIRRIKVKPRLAPHKAAMMKIQQIKEEKIWQSEDSKEYYTQLTDTLRQYINERYGFNAMEMTTSEIIEHLQEVNDENAIAELRELFETADLVKFAKYSTLINENDRNLVNAIEYINSTKKEEPAVQQPEEIVIVEKRSKVAKNVLLASVTAASIALLFTAGYLIYRIIMLNV